MTGEAFVVPEARRQRGRSVAAGDTTSAHAFVPLQTSVTFDTPYAGA